MQKAHGNSFTTARYFAKKKNKNILTRLILSTTAAPLFQFSVPWQDSETGKVSTSSGLSERVTRFRASSTRSCSKQDQ